MNEAISPFYCTRDHRVHRTIHQIRLFHCTADLLRLGRDGRPYKTRAAEEMFRPALRRHPRFCVP